MVTIMDIAKEAGVAKSTVSRFLNNGSVSPKTRKKIEAIVKKKTRQSDETALKALSKRELDGPFENSSAVYRRLVDGTLPE